MNQVQFSNPATAGEVHSHLAVSLVPTASAERGTLQHRLELKFGGPRNVAVRWQLAGPDDAPLLIVAGGISAHRHVTSNERWPEAGWWQAQAPVFGRYRVLAIDWLGNEGELDCAIDASDQAAALLAVIEYLDLPKAEAFVAASYGAMVAQHFAVLAPERVGKLVLISGAHRAHPFASAWRSIQRKIVALGALQSDAGHGLALARQLAMLSYRTPDEFAERFTEPVSLQHGHARCAAEDYLEHCGQKYLDRFTPEAFCRLSESIDLHRIDPATIRVPATVVAIDADQLVPLSDLQAMSEAMPQGHLEIIHSRYGHDAFLKEAQAISAIITSSLATKEHRA